MRIPTPAVCGPWALGALLALAALAAPAPSQQEPTGADYEAILARYKGYLGRPSLQKRTKGRELLAGTRDPRALDVLIQSYAKPEEPKDAVRYLIASKTMRAFQGKAPADELAAWRKKHDDAADAHDEICGPFDRQLSGIGERDIEWREVWI